MSSHSFNKVTICKLEPEQLSVIPKWSVGSRETLVNKKRGQQTLGKITEKMKNENYRWSQAQNRRYVQFLATNINLFDLPLQRRRKIKIQVMMSNFLNNRSPNQCRSHHQKMLNKFGSVVNIVSNLKHLLYDARSQEHANFKEEKEGSYQLNWGVKAEFGSREQQRGEISYSGQQKGWMKEEHILNQESYVFYKTFN